MTIAFNPQHDLALVVDGAERVTLLCRGSTPGQAGIVIAHALRQATVVGETTFGNRSEIRKHADSDAHALAADADWHLPAEELPDPPQLGDVILDASGCRWMILEVHGMTCGSRWKCVSRSLAIAHGLDDTISIMKYSSTDQTWEVWRTGIRARIQPFMMEVDDKNPDQSSKTRYRIILEESFSFDHTYRLRGPDGVPYRILWASGAPRLGELQMLEVVKVA
jgi:hypothetical protein